MIIGAANALAKAKRVAGSDILGQAHEPASCRALPRETFTHPEVGAVGLIEAQARSRNVVVRTAVSQVPSSPRGWIQGPGNDGFIKLIADSNAGVLVGAASGGPVGGEGFGALAVAVQAQVPVAVLSKMIYAYPTFHALSKTLSPGFAYAWMNEARSLQHVWGRHTSRDRRAPRRASPR